MKHFSTITKTSVILADDIPLSAKLTFTQAVLAALIPIYSAKEGDTSEA